MDRTTWKTVHSQIALLSLPKKHKVPNKTQINQNHEISGPILGVYASA